MQNDNLQQGQMNLLNAILNDMYYKLREEWECPITRELPIKPVIAEDGRVYEKAAIEKWIDVQQKERKKVKSPMTMCFMGSSIKPVSSQVQNTIDALRAHTPSPHAYTHHATTTPYLSCLWFRRVDEPREKNQKEYAERRRRLRNRKKVRALHGNGDKPTEL